MSEIASEAEWLLRSIAKAETEELSVKAAINAVYRVLRKKLPGLLPSRIEKIWYGDARIIKAEEMEAIREAAKLAQQRKAQDAYQAVAGELARLEAEIAALKIQIGDGCGLACGGKPHPGAMASSSCAMDRP